MALTFKFGNFFPTNDIFELLIINILFDANLSLVNAFINMIQLIKLIE